MLLSLSLSLSPCVCDISHFYLNMALILNIVGKLIIPLLYKYRISFSSRTIRQEFVDLGSSFSEADIDSWLRLILDVLHLLLFTANERRAILFCFSRSFVAVIIAIHQFSYARSVHFSGSYSVPTRVLAQFYTEHDILNILHIPFFPSIGHELRRKSGCSDVVVVFCALFSLLYRQ